jgi:hypothetical protein
MLHTAQNNSYGLLHNCEVSGRKHDNEQAGFEVLTFVTMVKNEKEMGIKNWICRNQFSKFKMP